MAKGTVLGDRRVLPEIRATLFSVTLVTGVVQRLANQLRFGSGPVRAVTAAAIHLAFEERVRKGFQCFAALQLMAVVTDLGLRRGLHYGIAWRVADVAIGAGNFVVVMWPTVPAEADVRIVATKANVVLRAYFGFLMGTEIDNGRTFLAAPDSRCVCSARAVAGLTLQLSLPERATRIGGHAVFGTKYC